MYVCTIHNVCQRVFIALLQVHGSGSSSSDDDDEGKEDRVSKAELEEALAAA